MDKIRLHNMEFFGYHGAIPEENRLGQRFKVDLELGLDLREAGLHDDLGRTVDYAQVHHLAKEIVEGTPYQLIEALAERLAQAVLERYAIIKEITVRVIKPHPPFDVHFDGVAVEIHRKREP